MINEDSSKKNASQTPPESAAERQLLVVGIGASAGGITALKQFFAVAPADSGMAFVVVLHLLPDHESNLATIIQTETAMPVVQVRETVKIEPNRVYVIPPDKNLTMVDSHIALTELENSYGTRTAIDFFFRTLADAYGRRAVAVVLSGTGTDGTLGLKRVKENGGFTIVQNESEAEYDEMPHSAIAAGLADLVLPIAEMPARLVLLRETAEKLDFTDDENAPPEVSRENTLREVLTLLKIRTGHDFSSYKRPTLLRRIARRLQVHGLDDIGAYLEFLRDTPGELNLLLADLLISVTNFFRDKETFAALEREVVPKLFAGKTSQDSIRVWVCGCATGEEAYSLAMLLCEYAGHLTEPPKIQIFASDINERAIAQARAGHYDESIQADVSPERLRRFFAREGASYRVRKQVREMILFAPHNILHDPPFSKLDLITCRNLLIYLARETQQKVLEIFSFGLNPSGFLFLGAAETAENASALFSVVDKKQRIYKSGSAAKKKILSALPITNGKREIEIFEQPPFDGREPFASFGELHHRTVELYAPPSAIINEQDEIVHLSQHAGRFLGYTGGELSRNLLKVVNPALRSELRTALLAARQENRTIEARSVRFNLDEREMLVNFLVRPVAAPEAKDFLLVIFEEAGNAPEVEPLPAGEENDGNSATDAAMHLLEDELDRTKARLRSTVEQHDVSSEELKASNEELQAINEELRSTTEELETGKEELQSVNEELQTVNHELKDKIEELSRANSDLQNLMASTEVGTLFLDRNLIIKRYTPNAETVFNVIPGDVGRSIEHITHNLEYDRLADDAREVLQKSGIVEREIRNADNRWFLARFLPYKTAKDQIDGVVLTFIDITRRKQSEENLARQSRIFDTTLSGISDFAYIFDCDGRFRYANQPLLDLLEITAEEIVGKNFFDLNYPEDLAARLQKQIQQVFDTGEIVRDDTPFVSPAGEQKFYEYILTPVFASDGAVESVAGSTRDITERKQATETLRQSEERLHLLIESAKDYAIISIAAEGSSVDLWNAGAQRLFGWTESEIVGRHCRILFAPEDRAAQIPEKEMENARENGYANDDRWHVRKDETRFFVSGAMRPLYDADGKLRGYVKIARDMTEKNLTEEQLRLARESLEIKVLERTAELAETNESLAAEIVERKQLEEERVRLLKKIVGTQEDERRRIALDLHDHLGQQLSALRLKLGILKEMSDPAELFAQIEQAQAIAQKIDSDVDFLAWELRPSALGDLGVAAAVSNYAREWSKQFNIPVEFTASRFGKTRLAPETEANLYRIAQESLNNISKHAGASRVEVMLERLDGFAVLIVEDDGKGFELEKVVVTSDSPRGLGLVGMRERAALVGGNLEIESSPGSGTTIFARVPAREDILEKTNG